LGLSSIGSITGIEAGIKWPNDVLIGARKVSGILIETSVTGGAVAYAIVGIGLNVALATADYPEIETTATSLSAEAKRDISRLEVARGLIVALDRLYLDLRNGGSLFEEWRDRLVTLGKNVRVTGAGNVQEGIAESVERDGSLVLRTSNGRLSRVIAGDVTLRSGAHPQ
jgi:BirA family biotin operon repressor/biotin-[acetyl-CoA-carboxylase] ligase